MAKRNWDRMREILLHVEQDKNDRGWCETVGDDFFLGDYILYKAVLDYYIGIKEIDQ